MFTFFRGSVGLPLVLLPWCGLAQPTAHVSAPTLLAGNIYELTTTDGQHQPTGRVRLRTVALRSTGGTTEATLRQEVFDVSGQLLTTAELPARFTSTAPALLDVRAFVNGQLLHALQLGGLDLAEDSLAVLPSLTEQSGQVFAPAYLTLKSLPGAAPRSVTLALLGRCLTGPTEIVRTTAGTFTCHRVTQVLEIERFDAGTQRRHTMRLVCWLAPATGVVRAETYIGTTLFDSTELTAIRPASGGALAPTAVAVER
ncbi:MAG: hypothetical protein H7330_01055 [Hymenobacteraceae bacterium]|nr:hypothetical protein [Hymenobacteraceae bacterium]